jgi:hypothetical protein
MAELDGNPRLKTLTMIQGIEPPRLREYLTIELRKQVYRKLTVTNIYLGKRYTVELENIQSVQLYIQTELLSLDEKERNCAQYLLNLVLPVTSAILSTEKDLIYGQMVLGHVEAKPRWTTNKSKESNGGKRQGDSNLPATPGKKPKTGSGVCNNFLEGKCKYGSKCHYQHPAANKPEVKPNPTKSGKKQACRYFTQGKCSNGEACAYEHVSVGAPSTPTTSGAKRPATIACLFCQKNHYAHECHERNGKCWDGCKEKIGKNLKHKPLKCPFNPYHKERTKEGKKDE